MLIRIVKKNVIILENIFKDFEKEFDFSFRAIRAATGTSWQEASNQAIKEQLLILMDNSHKTLIELALYFEGMNPARLFTRLEGFTEGREYLKGLISTIYLGLSKTREEFFQNDILKILGMPNSGPFKLADFLKKHMVTITQLTKDNIIPYIRFYAKMIIKHSDSAYNLLTKLNWDQVIQENSEEIHKRMLTLFGVSYKKAKLIYITGFLGSL